MFHVPAHKQVVPSYYPAQFIPCDVAPAAPAVEMDSYLAVGIAEGFIEHKDLEQYVEAWQFLIDSGLAWRLQGWFGRNAQSMIDGGHCHA